MFIRHYAVSSKLHSLEHFNHSFEFSSGRKLQFVNTPYSHSAGSFVTFDAQTGVLFTSDLFGSYGAEWDLFLTFEKECKDCTDYENCPIGETHCPLPGIIRFHEKIMTSKKALRFSLERISEIPFTSIASQHGSVIPGAEDIKIVYDRLISLEKVGIDRII